MPCKASIRQIGDVAIVDLSGRITLGDGSGVVRETVKDMLKGGQKNLLLNLGDVSYIDSSGLGELVGAYATSANQGAQIKLALRAATTAPITSPLTMNTRTDGRPGSFLAAGATGARSVRATASSADCRCRRPR